MSKFDENSAAKNSLKFNENNSNGVAPKEMDKVR